MSVGGIIGLCIAGAFVALLAFMLLRTAFTRPVNKERADYVPVETDENTVSEHLAEAIKIPTVSVPGDEGDFSAFDAYADFLEKTYPLLHKYAEKTVINGHSLVYYIKGKDETLLPACFLSHQDVVPANREEWSVEPFGGEIKDGYIYGRGSLDMKGHMIALLEGLEKLLEKELPTRGIYLCFGHDEELMGINGACKIVDYFVDKGIRTEYVVDEGGVIMDGRMLGVNRNVAAIGTCEKGYIDLKLTSTMNGGHASSPKKRSSVDSIGEAVFYLSHMPMKAYWSKPIKQTFDNLAPYMCFGYKFLFVNRDILSPLLKAVVCRINPIMNSLFRTTFAFTQLKGSDATNVVPNTASAVVNVRVNMGQSTEEVIKYIKKVVGKNIEVTVMGRAFEPVAMESVENETYKNIVDAVDEVFGYVCTPYPFIAASDAKYYNKISDSVFRFGPLEMEADDQNRIHSKDERCKVSSLVKGTQFFYRFIEKTCY